MKDLLCLSPSLSYFFQTLLDSTPITLYEGKLRGLAWPGIVLVSVVGWHWVLNTTHKSIKIFGNSLMDNLTLWSFLIHQ